MQQPKVLVLTGYGINCDYETQHAFQKAGAQANRVHINELIENPKQLEEYQIIFVPGGFSYGDELGAGKVLANKIRMNLEEEILQFIRDGKLIGGHCNGAQAIVKAGLIPGLDGNYITQTATLTNNDSHRYEDRWVTLKSVSQKCIWTNDLPLMRVPVAHGEGKFYSSDATLIQNLKENDQITLIYVTIKGEPANGKFPDNPNGSIEDIAGICDPTGRVFAQMPHHERFTSRLNHPLWTRQVRKELKAGKKIDEIDWDGKGLLLFKNPVNYAIEKLV